MKTITEKRRRVNILHSTRTMYDLMREHNNGVIRSLAKAIISQTGKLVYINPKYFLVSLDDNPLKTEPPKRGFRIVLKKIFRF